MTDHLSRLSAALDAAPLDDDEVTSLLDVARDVAHTTERKAAPLSTFLAGLYVGGRLTESGDRSALLDEAVERLRSALRDHDG